MVVFAPSNREDDGEADTVPILCVDAAAVDLGHRPTAGGMTGGLVGVAGGMILGAGALFGLDMPIRDIQLPWSVAALGLLAGMLLAVLAALGPARRVTLASPAEAVRS